MVEFNIVYKINKNSFVRVYIYTHMDIYPDVIYQYNIVRLLRNVVEEL